MTITSRDYAALSEDSYRHPQSNPNSTVTIEGVNYRVLANSDRPSGYQGTIYQRVDTHEIVVAHRGTEPSRGTGELFRDAVRTDGGMVVNGVNNQTQDAMDLTRRAVEIARAEAERTGRPAPEVTVTGHSLGGTLAQITAHEFGLKGETFNAYGAAGLRQGVPAGGNDVINHVRATDVVSAASPHYGQTRVYATPDDIEALRDGGYRNDRSRWDIRNPLEVAWDRGGPAHAIGAFVRAEGGGPLMSQDNLQRAQQFDPMIDKFRDDVGGIRSGITNTSIGVQDGVQRVRDGWNRLFSENSAGPQQSPLVSDNPMLAQAYREFDRTGQQPDARVVAGVVAGAQQQGLTGIDHLAANNGTLFAVQGRSPDDPAARIANVSVDTAMRQPLAANSEVSAQGQTQLAQAPQQDQEQTRMAMRA
ncbi:XVIPCD domain-containing protein [Lysobacter hankyongensis]|uniref:X-Tfes XVIPCD domain-containing protein n=1 Tax=Lysobacter hankyongensis TaxID=1176535 RepID=A0ABP9B964_9GAMM